MNAGLAADARGLINVAGVIAILIDPWLSAPISSRAASSRLDVETTDDDDDAALPIKIRLLDGSTELLISVELLGNAGSGGSLAELA